jgi:putative membrane protein
MVKPLAFTKDDHARVDAAIRAAEKATRGEIFAVFTRASDSYVFASSFFALVLTFAAALVSAIVAAVAEIPVSGLTLQLTELVFALLLVLALRLSVPLRMLFVPAWLKAERAHRTALAQFMAHDLKATEDRTGILIFVSEAEHHAEVIADAGINARVPQAEWDALVAVLVAAAKADRLADGYVEAIAKAGDILARHFPADGRNPNELPDRLVEL